MWCVLMTVAQWYSRVRRKEEIVRNHHTHGEPENSAHIDIHKSTWSQARMVAVTQLSTRARVRLRETRPV